MWVSNKIEIESKVGEINQIIFSSLEPLKKIQSFQKSCSCLKVDQISNTDIKVTYRSKPVPRHLKDRGFYLVSFSVIVIFEDQTRETLKFKIKITQV